MLLTQKFHSLQEIDAEFIPALEALTHEHWVDFSAWKAAEAAAPADTTYAYWLFFGPTQNTPVGVAQLSLQRIDTENLLPWWKKASRLFDKNIDHWKSAHWQLGTGLDGMAVFDARFSRTGHDKLRELLREVEAREDVMALSLTSPQGGAYRPSWKDVHHEAKREWTLLAPWQRQHKSYQDYLAALAPAAARSVQQDWRRLHKEAMVTIGDFPTKESRQELYKQCPRFDEASLQRLSGGLLSFQKDGQLLGLVHYREGQQGALFIEPIPHEPQGAELVNDGLYLQYALLKAHELPQVRKVVLAHEVSPQEEPFFQQHGFHARRMQRADWSRSPFVK